MEPTVNFVDWMNAIDVHPDLDGEHLVTAACIANGESVCTGCILDEYGYEPCENCALVSDLEETGFLVDESRIETETDDGGSGLVVYAFHIPDPMIRTYWCFGEAAS